MNRYKGRTSAKAIEQAYPHIVEMIMPLGGFGLGLEGIVSKKLDAPYKSGPSKVWLKVKNPKAPAATRAIDGTF
jgi:ATP-dependent DNA ligase